MTLLAAFGLMFWFGICPAITYAIATSKGHKTSPEDMFGYVIAGGIGTVIAMFMGPAPPRQPVRNVFGKIIDDE